MNGVMAASQFKQLRRSYGFDEVAIVPGDITINPDQTDIDFKVEKLTFSIPIMAAAMDAVTDVNFAVLMSQVGGLAVLNLEGVQTRYDNPQEILAEIARVSAAEVTSLLQKVYTQPIKENLIGERIQAVKKSGAVCAVSAAPANTKRFAPIAAEARADIFVVQSTVTSARHISRSYRGLIFSELRQSVSMPIIVGNCVSYSACLEMMRTGISGVLVGVGPGAACTTREVLGVGVPQITATIDCAAARDQYQKESGGLEYANAWSLGADTGVGDLDAITFANFLCNEYGMDPISHGVTVAAAMELFETGAITEAEVGFSLKFGDAEAMVKLTEMTGKGEGFGKDGA